jgi:hydroxymethylbilane synthase
VSVILLGLNHRTVPLELLERLAVEPGRLPKALHDLRGRPHVTEAVVLSTCNRTEVYAVAERFHGGVADLRDFLCDLAFLAPEDVSDHLYNFHDGAVAEHLFSVAAGIDSVVVGESEILGQVKGAWERAQEERAVGPHLNLLFRHAVEVGKRARTETSIGRHVTSVSQAAVALAGERLGSLEGRRVLVLGAGDMGEGMAVALAGAGVAELAVANRSWERAVALADRLGGRAVPLARLPVALAEVDVLLTSTGATSVLVGHADLEPVVAALLAAVDPDVLIAPVVVETTGDRVVDRPLWQLGGQGAFVKEVQAAVLEGRADLAVHSAKDLPPVTVAGLVLAAVPPRGDPRDALVGATLEGLATGAVVATGSPRRRAQLAGLRPDLTFAELRGNIGTRLRKAVDHDAVVVAAAALDRLGEGSRAAERLHPATLLPQVGQGALAVECRADDAATTGLLEAVDHRPSRRAVEAERAFLAALGSGCRLPVAGHATVGPGDQVDLDGLLATLDGRIVLRQRRSGPDPGTLGRDLATFLLEGAGGAGLLADAGL